jgi:hypothetical protein
MLRLRSIFVGRLGHFCSVGQRTCRRTTLTAGEKWARLSGISCTTGPVCGAVGYDANTVDRWSARGGPGARFGGELPSSPIPSGTYRAHGSGSVMAGCGARWGCLLTGRPAWWRWCRGWLCAGTPDSRALIRYLHAQTHRHATCTVGPARKGTDAVCLRKHRLLRDGRGPGGPRGLSAVADG